MFWAILIGACTTVNMDPNILATEPYSKVVYVPNSSAQGYETIDTVEVTTRGEQANILNTIPKLYERVLAESKEKSIPPYLGNIRFSSFTKKESYQVSYEDCHTETKYETQSDYTCTGFGTDQQCSTNYTNAPVSEQVCETKYRTEERIVLYQKAQGDILSKKRVPDAKK